MTFDDKDMEMPIILDHGDLLLLKAFINKKEVCQLLVDIGSYADIMFYDFFRNLSIQQLELLLYIEDLLGFSGHHNEICKVSRNLREGISNQNHRHHVHYGEAIIILQHDIGQTNLECPESCDFDISSSHEVPQQ